MEVTAEQDAGFLSKLWFAWVSPLMTPSLHAAFQKRLLARNRLPLLWALYEVFKFDFWLGAVSQFVVSTLQVVTPFTLRFLIEWVQHSYRGGHDTRGSTPVETGIRYVLGIAVLQILQTSPRASFTTGAWSEGSGPYDGIPCRVDEKGWSNGGVMSRVSNDTARIEQVLVAFHLTWLSLYRPILTIALLVCNLGWTALPGAATLIFGLAAVTYATRPLVASRNRINIVTDQRVTLTQEILESIRFVKYFGWEGFFQDRLRNIRASETRALRIMHLIRCALATLAQFLPVLATIITFIFLIDQEDRGLLLAEEVQAQTVPDVTLALGVKLSNASFTWESPPANEECESRKDNEKKNRLSRAMRR
ncbi:hypothetical protein LZL87_003146 [Fusarium oxysporum]|nr:hypothetical protein LZL87_003146 [Fusarium oxysporum]